MPNINYRRGRAKEYRLKKQLEKEGWLVLRTAGSHGPFDLVTINPSGHTIERFDSDAIGIRMGQPRIRLIQVKGGKSQEREKSKALKEIKKFDGLYSVTAEVM